MSDSAPSRITVVEDDGYGVLVARHAARQTPTPVVTLVPANDDQPQRPAADESVLHEAVRETLLEALTPAERVRYLDVFAPAQTRNAAVVEVLRAAIRQQAVTGGPLAQVATDAATLTALYAAALGWGPAQRYLDDPDINEVKINGTTILVQERGKPFVEVNDRFADPAQVLARVQLLASTLGVVLDDAHPQATIPLTNGNRMHVTIPPCTVSGALIAIRRGRTEGATLDQLLQWGAFDSAVHALLTALARARASILLVGRTNSGKTTLLEALANSAPPSTHIVTIEDNALEISIRRASLWTREALRQSPGLVCVGETRGNEAGAILALLRSDHPVLTTIHAASCASGLTALAENATLPGSYLYEGRFAAALQTACAGVDVVIHLDFVETIGRRLITRIVLVNGVRADEQPDLITLAALSLTADGPQWHCHATVQDGVLDWGEHASETPEALHTKLSRVHVTGLAQLVGTAQDATLRAESRATALLAGGATSQALAQLAQAWGRRPDTALLLQAQQTIAHDPHAYVARAEQARAQRGQLEDLIAARQWAAADRALTTLLADLVTAALAAPADGFVSLRQQIADGLAAQERAEEIAAGAAAALARGQAQAALTALTELSDTMLSLDDQYLLSDLRVQATEQLHAAGAVSAMALTVTRARCAAIAAQRAQQLRPADSAATDGATSEVTHA